MGRRFIISDIVLVFLGAFISLPIFPANETITVDSYFPSVAAYKTLKLGVTNTKTESCNEGEVCYDDGLSGADNGLYYCDDGVWKPVGSGAEAWTLSGDDIYYTDGNVGIGADTPEFTLHLDNDGGIIAKGEDAKGYNLTTAGAGTRFIWYPKKAAFRAGGVDGEQWDNDKIPFYCKWWGCQCAPTIAWGYNTVAGGEPSIDASGRTTAMGCSTKAYKGCSTAMGYNTTANAPNSVAMGYNTTTNASYSVAMGYNTTANSDWGVVMGYNTVAEAGAVAMGYNNTAREGIVMGYNNTADVNNNNGIVLGANNIGQLGILLGYNSSTFEEDEWFRDYKYAVGSYISSPREAFTMGKGVDAANPLVNNYSGGILTVGFNSTVPTLVVFRKDQGGTGRFPVFIGNGNDDFRPSTLNVGGEGTISLPARNPSPIGDAGVWKLHVFDNDTTQELRVTGPSGTHNNIVSLTQ